MKKMIIQNQHGNVLFMILIAIFLIGSLTVALMATSKTGDENIDNETMSIRASEVHQFASEVETAIRYIFEKGYSESDLRFAHPNAPADYGDINSIPERQVFSFDGGGAKYKLPGSGINDGSPWEFYGNSALPQVGTDEPELIAVLPNVNEQFCNLINNKIGYAAQPTDNSTCVYGGAAQRFDDGVQFSTAGASNTFVDSSFSIKPSLRVCVLCDGTGRYHYVQVLMAR